MTPENVLYYASVKDAAGYTVSYKTQYRFAQMAFDGDFEPVIEHYPSDDFPVQPAPAPCPPPPPTPLTAPHSAPTATRFRMSVLASPSSLTPRFLGWPHYNQRVSALGERQVMIPGTSIYECATNV